MSLREEFLKTKTYEEYEKKRELFGEVVDNMNKNNEKEVQEHWRSFFPTLGKDVVEDGVFEEVYSYLPDGRRVLGGKGNTKPPENKRKNI